MHCSIREVLPFALNKNKDILEVHANILQTGSYRGEFHLESRRIRMKIPNHKTTVQIFLNHMETSGNGLLKSWINGDSLMEKWFIKISKSPKKKKKKESVILQYRKSTVGSWYNIH